MYTGSRAPKGPPTTYLPTSLPFFYTTINARVFKKGTKTEDPSHRPPSPLCIFCLTWKNPNRKGDRQTCNPGFSFVTSSYTLSFHSVCVCVSWSKINFQTKIHWTTCSLKSKIKRERKNQTFSTWLTESRAKIGGPPNQLKKRRVVCVCLFKRIAHTYQKKRLI